MNKIFFIAEIGINHNGDINIAKQLIDLAAEANFDAVKFQKRTIDQVYSKDFLDSDRESPWGKTQRDQKEGLEFSKEEFDEINDYCKKKSIIWFASAWDHESLNFLDQYNLNYNKIASAMIIDQEFLKQVAIRKKYTFISTGMATVEIIEDAVKIFKKYDCPFELMHCISTYPMDTKEARLSTIAFLKKKFSCKVGYSGHESGLAVSFAAFKYNISSLERHITLDRAMYGSDQSASLAPKGAIDLVKTLKKMERADFGEIKENILKSEENVAKKLREHIKANYFQK